MRRHIFVFLLSFLTVFPHLYTQAEPTRVTIQGNQLHIQKPGTTSTMPYTIKGVSWSPATTTPENGPHPLTGDTVPYGFFFDYPFSEMQGYEIFSHWYYNEFLNHYQQDIPLLKSMNINTVRIYNDFYNNFDENPDAFRTILDELYQNDIMILLTVAGSRSDVQSFMRSKKDVYTEYNSTGNCFIASGWMGDTANIQYADNWSEYPYNGKTCIKFTYSGSSWAGIYYQYPQGNWGDAQNKIGQNLIGNDRLVFKAKGENGGEILDTVRVGGLTGDTVDINIGPITLTNQWKEYVINLEGQNLENVQGGFCFTVSRNQTFYLDEIHFAYYVDHERSKQSVYREHNSTENLFTPCDPEGENGSTISYDTNHTENPYRGSTSIRVTYTGSTTTSRGGLYFKNVSGNTGSEPGMNLATNNKLIFMAKGQNGGEIISKVQIGGITNDTALKYIENVILTNKWTEYTIDLTNEDLTDIRAGLYISFSGQGESVIYLDEIRFAQTVPGKYYKVIDEFKDHPAILGWTLGNEWNINHAFGFDSVEEAAQAFNNAALEIKNLDTNHPVISILGDIFSPPSTPSGMWFVNDCIEHCPEVDIWGLNVYRGTTFGSLFTQWPEIFTSLGRPLKPMFISEFGIDSYHSESYSVLPGTTHKGINITGHEDETAQADAFDSLWSEISAQLSQFDPDCFCLGGSVHEFSDEWWKVGNFHAQMGDMVDYEDALQSTSYQYQNNEGFILPSIPDSILNEEHFGILKNDRTPKEIFNRIQTAFATDEGIWSPNENGTLYENRSWDYTMGYHFTPLKDGTITKLGGYFSGTKIISLWNRSTGELLREVQVSSANDWSYTDITPVSVSKNEEYTISVYLNGTGGSQRSNINSFPRTYSEVTILGSCWFLGNGRPTNIVTNTMYGQVDIVFIPENTPVNSMPIITTEAVTDAFMGEEYTYNVNASDPDNDDLTFSLTQNPAGMTIDSSTGLISWIPPSEAVGSHTVTVEVTDSKGGNDSQTFTLEVRLNTLDAQTPWSSNENGTVRTGLNWNYTLGYHFTPQKNGTITKLGGYFNGTKNVYLWNKDTGELLREVQVTSDNNWSFAYIDPISVNAATNYTAAVYSNGTGVAYRSGIQPLPQTYGDITIQGSCWKSGFGRPTNTVTNTMYGQVDVYFVSQSLNQNQNPIITSTAPANAVVNELYQYQVTATDPDNDQLTFSLTQKPTGMNIDIQTGYISWNPVNTQTGTHSITVEVTDGNNGKGTQTFSIQVNTATAQTPWSSNENGTIRTGLNWDYTLGYHFIPLKNGTITKLGGYFNGTKTLYLWNKSTGELLREVQITSDNNWSFAAIDPIAVTANTNYTIAVYSQGNGVAYRNNIQELPQTFGDITIQSSCWKQASGRPTNAVSNTMYGQVDIQFVPNE